MAICNYWSSNLIGPDLEEKELTMESVSFSIETLNCQMGFTDIRCYCE